VEIFSKSIGEKTNDSVAPMWRK